MRNVDGWGMAFIVLGTAAIVSMLPATPSRLAQPVRDQSPMALTQTDVDYKIVITGNKMPAECKDLGANASSDLVLKCTELSARETQMTMSPVNATVKVADKP